MLAVLAGGGRTMSWIRGAALFSLLLTLACTPAAPTSRPPEAATPSAAAAPSAGAAPNAPRAAASPATTGAPAASAPLSPPVLVRIGALPTLGMAPFLIAETRGYFAEEGLQVEYTTFDSGARMVAP